MSSEQVATAAVAEAPAERHARASGRGCPSRWFLLIGAGHRRQHRRVHPRPAVPARGCTRARPARSRRASSRAPWSSRPRTRSSAPRSHPADELDRRSPRASARTILTMWIVMAIVVVGAILMIRGCEAHPGPRPERVRVVLRVPERLRRRPRRPGGASRTSRSSSRSSCSSCSATGSAWSRRRPDRVPARADERRQHHHRPGAGRFVYLPDRGLPRLGVGGYLGKFFPFYEFKNGIGAGLIALFVGLIELMLEFVKPVTLSMRLFGNIYGGEVALGVITRADDRLHPGRAARPGGHAQRRSRHSSSAS